MPIALSPTVIIVLAGLAAVACVGGLMFVLFAGRFEDEARQSKRRAMIDPGARRNARDAQTPMMSAQAQAQQRIRDLQLREQKKGQFRMSARLEQAGLATTPVRFMMGFYVAAVAVFLGLVVFGQPLYVGALGAVAVALGLPRLVLQKLIARRQSQFVAHFANAIDILVRGVRSGLPINECLRVISSESPEPVRGEFKRLVDAMSVGVSFEDALQKMIVRMPLSEVNFFATVLIIQRQTGGNLADALGNLSGILRGRKQMKMKVVALSTEARASAMIIGSLPFIVGLMVYLVSPDYLMPLFTDPQGNIMLGAGLVWMSFGVLMMRAMTKFEV